MLYKRRKTDLENRLYKTYDKMNKAEKRELLSQLVDNVQIYEERKENVAVRNGMSVIDTWTNMFGIAICNYHVGS